MKIKQQLLITAFAMLSLCASSYAQEKKYKIFIDMEKNGTSTVIDTTFNSKADMDAYMTGLGMEAPPAPEHPGENEFVFEIEDTNMSDEEIAKMKDDMKKAHQQMKKEDKQHKRIRKEKKSGGEEMNWIEIDETVKPGERVIIKRSHGEKGEGEKKMILITDDEENGTSENVKVIHINCDEIKDGEGKVRIIRKVREGEPAKEEVHIIDKDVKDQTSEEVIDESAPSTKPETVDYKLQVTDFKLFPNPTEGKIGISFEVETPGTIQIVLMDASGKTVIDESVPVSDGRFNKTYDLKGNSRGTYLLQIKQGNQWRHEKVVLKG